MTTTHDFSGRTVLVTGGTRGIGRAIAEGFLAAGADVVVCGRRQPDFDVSHGDRDATFLEADVREPEACQRLVDDTVERLGRLDVVVNNAGGSPWAEAATASASFSEKVVALNLMAPLHLSQAANAVMQQQEAGGCIVNIASISGTRPSPGTAAYGAAKAGLLNLTQSLAVEWAPKVRVNAVVAGLIRTEQSHLHYGDADGVAAAAATVPLGRLGDPGDVAAACRYLASDEASYVTGGQVLVHGGGEPPPFLAAVRDAGRR